MAIDEKKLKEDLIQWFAHKKKFCKDHLYDSLLEDYEECFDEFTDIIEAQPKLSLENKIRNNWIPYDNKHERPKKVGRYRVTELSYFAEPLINFRFWNGCRFEGCDGIIAWQPNPEPYKKQSCDAWRKYMEIKYGKTD